MLHVHRAERADALADALAGILAEPLEDPFGPEVVAVPTRGMERWLTQRLSQRLGVREGRADGVCANVDFPFPGNLIDEALAAATDLDPDHDPWITERSIWPLVRVVDECRDEAWLAPLRGYFGLPQPDDGGPGHDRRVAAVRHIADLFDRYAIHRPAMIRHWAGGQDVDDAGDPLPDEHAWQPLLWRRLREAIGDPSPAERLEQAYDGLRASADVLDWPRRVSVFPLTRLPASYLQVLSAAAAWRDVHLFVLHPSPALWDDILGTTAADGAVMRRDRDPTVPLARNWILASWGRDARELQLVLSQDTRAQFHAHPVPDPPPTLLGLLQTDVRANREAAGEPALGGPDARPSLDPDDRSIQVHSCHGRARQVEVMRDAILHLLEEDESLQPRDVIVMCPDIETFAPLIQATFGAGELATEDQPALDAHPPDLRVRLADRSLRQTNPVLGVVADMLDLADARVTASELLSLADREPVRRRFGFGDDELARIQDWVVDSGIHWGLDAPSRAPFKLTKVSEGTWESGLDRILLGVAMSEEGRRQFGPALPLDDVETGAIELAGRFAEYVGRVQSAVAGLGAPKRIENWAEAISSAARSLTLTAPWEAWQTLELERVLQDVSAAATARDETFDTPVTLADLRLLLSDLLRGRPTRANFRTGHLTICTLVPMRSVPHRVVCLLGLSDNEFPRKVPHDGDDLVLRNPHVGDRSPRAEDRQMLLDALLAASEHLIVTYTGNDERTNTERPPAVPVAELLDVIDRTVRLPDGSPAREQVVVRHPLQPFDARSFEPGRLVPDVSWSFDRAALAGAKSITGTRSEPAPFLTAPLPPVTSPVVELRDLMAFVDRPVRAFLRRRLNIAVFENWDEVDDALPLELDGLGKWNVAERLLEARLGGLDWIRSRAAEIMRGELPPEPFGGRILDEIAPTVEALAQEAQKLTQGQPSLSKDVRVRLDDGRLLTGAVPGICGTLVHSVSYARVGPRHRLGAWVQLLALTAAQPDQPWEAAVLGRARGSWNDLCICRIPPLETGGDRRELALKLIAPLVEIHDRGLREPLPIYRLTSAAFAEASFHGDDPYQAARGKWESDFNRDGEDRQMEHIRVFGGQVPFEQLLDDQPKPDEAGPGWEEAETTRVGRYARRLWADLLGRERISEW